MGTSARRAQDGARARASRAAGPSLSSQPRPVRPPLPAPRERRSSGLLRDDGCHKEERGLWQRRGTEDGAPHGLWALAAEGALARLVPTRARPHTEPGLAPALGARFLRLPKQGEAGSTIQSYPVPSFPLDLFPSKAYIHLLLSCLQCSPLASLTPQGQHPLLVLSTLSKGN